LRWAALAGLALGLTGLVHAQGATIRSGHGGHWFDPARDGEGFALEILDNDGALLYWFTYDETGQQRWLTAVGRTQRDADGDYLDFPQLVVTRGGRFGPNFDPAQVERRAVGTATLRFADCDSGEFSFSAFGQALTLPLRRLAHTMGMPCESRNGVPGRVSTVAAGQSGSWFDPGHSGEGYSLQWLNPGSALVTWYSYDTDGEQYWMLGVGQLDAEGRLFFPQMHSTRGGVFGAAFDPDDIERFEWGAMTLTLGCDNGQAQYTSVLSAFGAGGLQLQRLTRPRGLGCPNEAPALTDLYEIAYRAIPLPPVAQANSMSVDPVHVASDGTVYGVHRTVVDPSNGWSRHQLAQLAPGASDWQILPDADLGWPAGGGQFSTPFLSDSGREVARHHVSYEGANLIAVTMQSRADLGPWLPLAGLSSPFVHTNAASRNLEALVGGGSFLGVPSTYAPWRWTAQAGQQDLPVPEDTRTYQPVPVAVGSQGRVVLGHLYAPRIPGGWRSRALRWVDGGEPETLYDDVGAELGVARACSADCGVIFGSGQAFRDPNHPSDRQAWFWRGPGDMAYLGELEVGVDPGFVGSLYGVSGVSGDGSFAAGVHVNGASTHPAVNASREAMLWTQRTGLVSIGELARELQWDEGGETWTVRGAGPVTVDGRIVLLTGSYFDEANRIHRRAALLSLHPRSSDW
jgi:hypothetical protein